MSETDTNKQDDTDVLRAEDIQEASESRPSDGRGEIPKFDLAEQILAEQRKITAIRRKAPGKKPQRLPSLAPPLLSATADKGVTQVQAQDGAAGKKTKAPDRQPHAPSNGYTIKPPSPTLSEQEQIIAEIVAKDIERLCGEDTSSLRNW